MLLWFKKKLDQFFVHHINIRVDIFFGPPGVGKSTTAAYFAKKYMRHGVPVYSNMPIIGAFQFDPRSDLGSYDIQDALVLLDEASTEFNNRRYNDMPMNVIKWLKLHRHANCKVIVFSQSWDDMDITLRRLSTNYYLVNRSLIPNHISYRRIRKKIGIDEQTHQVIDMYAFVPLSRRLIPCRQAWKMFDSWDMPSLPVKTFEKW